MSRDLEAAREHIERAIELAESVGYHVLVAPAKGLLAECLGVQGDVTGSRRLREEAVALITDDVLGLPLGGTLSAAAQAAATVGDDGRAVEIARADLMQMRDTGALITLRPTIGALAMVATRRGDLRRAAQLWGVWGGYDPSSRTAPFVDGVESPAGHYPMPLSEINEVRNLYPEEYDAGAAMSPEEAMTFALTE